MSNDSLQFAVDWWKNRHDMGYFPMMEQHKDWKVYDEMPQWFLDAIKPTKDDIALEIGCGYGAWMVPLSRLVEYVAGFDIHRSLYNKGYEKFLEHNVYNAEMILGNGLSIPYCRDSIFTLVYSMAVFYHIPRAITSLYLRETVRVLRKGGRCLHTFLSSAQEGTVQDIVKGQGGEWSVGWTMEEVHDEAKKAGLTNVTVVDCGMLLLLANKP